MKNFAIAVLAFFIYGSWAAWVNSEYGFEIMLRSGLGQGSYAFCSTWIVTASTRYVLHKRGSHWQGALSAFICSFCLMLSLPLAVHGYLKTPDILEAILPGILWGSLYIIVLIKVTVKLKTV